jgi:hypothetical protein
MKKIILYLAIIIAAAMLPTGCGKDYFPPVDLGDQPISFSQDLVPIFTKSCLGGCHPGQNTLNLEAESAYDNLIDGNYVDTLKPEQSLLYKRVGPGGNMPTGGKLPAVEIQKILLWIKQGAQNN